MDYQDSPPLEHDQDSSSSSSGDHSSPSDSASNSDGLATSIRPGGRWAYDLGLGTMLSLPEDGWGVPVEPVFGMLKGGGMDQQAAQYAAVHPDQTGIMGGLMEEGSLALTGDFWSTAPSTTVHSPADSRSYSVAHGGTGPEGLGSRRGSGELDIKPDLKQVDGMEVEFDDMVHDDQCGPSSFPSPAGSPPAAQVPPPLTSSFLPPAHPSFPYVTNSMSLPVDLHAVNAGIAPQLTGGNPSPPLDASKQIHEQDSIVKEEDELDMDDEDDLESQGHLGASESGSREPSETRKRERAATAMAPAAPTATAPPPLNLVAKDAVVTSSIIETLLSPPASTITPRSGLKLLVLGVPTVGAKSRVETQIKISLVLVGGKKAAGMKGEDFLEEDGGIKADAGKDLSRIGTWSHVRLPHFLALKKKNKKQVKPDPPTEDTLSLEVAVIRGSEPQEEIFICSSCQQRELKRAQRKKDARVRPPQDVNDNGSDSSQVNEDEEKRKVVVFNTSEFVEFGQGETILPTRITCYCRHHKERKGFSIQFTLRTPAGIVVASGATPPIMITDDHKTSGKPSATASADISLDSIEAPATKANKRSKTAAAAKPSSNASSTRSKRGAGGRKSRAATESDEEITSSAAVSRSSSTSRKSKPYDSDKRPKKRTSGVHKSPSFAMTPLIMSKPGSPVLRPAPDPASAVPPLVAGSTSALPPLVNNLASASFGTRGSLASVQREAEQQWGSALGLGGMVDATLPRESNASTFFGSSAYSTAPSSAPSPAHSSSNDWRSTASSPPLSPGSFNANNVDTFASFFNGLGSPDPSTQPSSVQSSLSSPLLQGLQQQVNNNFAQLFDTSNRQAMAWGYPQATPPPPPPRISRLIPGEGPVHGGIEVTVLGENFVRDLVCVFGDTAAVPTHYWSANTLVCILPPSANPGPVVVGIKGVPLTVEQGTGLQLFTYKDDSDRSLLELALQVVGLKMTGRLEDASAVAMRIVGNNGNGSTSGSQNPSRHVSPTDANGLAMRMNAATHTVHSRQSSTAESFGSSLGSPNSSRPSSRAPSRQGSFANLAALEGTSATPTMPLPAAGGDSRNFEGIVIKFLSLLDLDPSLIPGSAPSLPLAESPISHVNGQRHTLLHLATLLGFHRLVTFLLIRGIDVDSVDRNGYTALHFAALYGRVAITRQLLDAGAAAYSRTLAGKTPLDIARGRDDVDVEEVILRLRPVPTPMRVARAAAWTGAQASTPTSRPRPFSYARSLGSDGDESCSESDFDSDSDDGSFHSSDEEESDGSDLERRLSRNNSMVSLHYLLEAEAEAEADAEYEPTVVPDLELDTDDDARTIEAIETKEAPSSPEQTSTQINDLASASGAWLSRNLKPSIPFPPTFNSFNSFNKFATPTGLTEAWGKMSSANGAWEKMRLPQGFTLPLPELTVFQSNLGMANFSPKSWMGSKPEAEAGGESDTETAVSTSTSTDTKSKYGPWWQPKIPVSLSSSPPPMYSPTDPVLAAAAASAPPAPILPVVPEASTSTAPPAPATNKSHLQAKLQRKVGYAPGEVPEALGQSLVYHEKKMRGLKQDKMLFLFWLPILLIVIACAIYSSFGLYIRPVLLVTVDTLLPFTGAVRH